MNNEEREKWYSTINRYIKRKMMERYPHLKDKCDFHSLHVLVGKGKDKKHDYFMLFKGKELTYSDIVQSICVIAESIYPIYYGWTGLSVEEFSKLIEEQIKEYLNYEDVKKRMNPLCEEHAKVAKKIREETNNKKKESDDEQ